MTRKRRLDPKERDIQKACEDLLQLDQWRILRMEQNFSERKVKTVGEAGMPDCLALRYFSMFDVSDRADDVLWIEWKRLKGKPSTEQKLWHAAERQRGALVILAGEDFEASVDGFLEWYRTSGLMRRSF